MIYPQSVWLEPHGLRQSDLLIKIYINLTLTTESGNLRITESYTGVIMIKDC